MIESAVMNAVAADLDGDGQQEILYPAYDGRLHAWWLDKSQHGSWLFDVPGAGIRFASEPVVVDLDNDGRAEVIVTPWTQKGSGESGQLHILDADGNQLSAVPLPAPGAGSSWNGGLGAPTVANIDPDGELEVGVGTSHSGGVAYDLPGSAGARPACYPPSRVASSVACSPPASRSARSKTPGATRSTPQASWTSSPPVITSRRR